MLTGILLGIIGTLIIEFVTFYILYRMKIKKEKIYGKKEVKK